ncbi:MAG: alpha/beta hydrolase [Candidatus Paceibacterota bacterium]
MNYLLSRLAFLAISTGVVVQVNTPCLAQHSANQPEPDVAIQRSLDELLLFFPSKHPAGNWAPDNLRFKDVWFTAEDETRVHGWYCPCDNPRATILIAHGNAGSVASRARWLRYLQSRMRVSTFMFDYRGYGRSEGVPTVEGAIQDARAAREKLRELAKIKDSEMLLMGESLGGAIAVQLAAESAPRALILQSTFSSLRDVADVHFPRLSWLVPADKLDSASQISRFRGPLLQSHGTADRTVPFASGEKLFRSANGPKDFFAVAGADHNNWFTQNYLRRLDDFVDDVNQHGE